MMLEHGDDRFVFPEETGRDIPFWWVFIAGALAAIIVIAWIVTAKAGPLESLSADWQAYATQQAHVQDDLNALVAEHQKLKADAKESDDRLKWVLENWVPHAPDPPK